MAEQDTQSRRDRVATTRLAACGVLLAAIALTGCSTVSEVGVQDPRTPTVGQCYDTPDSVLPAASDPTAAVDCEQPHTLETYAVLHVEGRLDEQATAEAGDRCVAAVDEFLGGPGFWQTAVSVFYFTPTEAERADGARWVRCDAAVVADTAVRGARQVTGSLRNAFVSGVPDRYRQCLDTRPDPARPQPLVRCDLPHVAELVPEVRSLGDAGNQYPGVRRLVRRARPWCARVAGAAVPGAEQVVVVVPTARLWEHGRTSADCWALAQPGEPLGGSETQTA